MHSVLPLHKVCKLCFLALAIYPISLLAQSSSQTPFIAGLAPYERPQGAPGLLEALPEAVRTRWATHGISEPVPPSILAFLKYQGAWYTPFSHPGMTGNYDIRGWHTAPVQPEKR